MVMDKVKLKNRLIKAVSIFIMPCLFLSACATKSIDNNLNKTDIVTQKKLEEGRTPITISIKYAFSINEFEKIVEEKFPDIDLVQVGDFTANPTLGKEYETRLKNDDLTDIILTWPIHVGEEYLQDRLIDLSGKSFTSQYNKSMLDSLASDDGSLYYVPGPATIRSIIYNKTLFAENGWEVPNNYTEFVALCKKIEATGMRAFQLPLGNDEVLDTAFVGFNYGTAYSKPSDTAWLAQYNQGIGSFLDQFSSSVDTFQNLFDEDILKATDLDLTYSDTQANLFTRKIAMSEDSVGLALTQKALNSNDEYALMPFFNRTPESDWARIYLTCYIGLNKHLEEPENKDKYEKVMELMDYISSEEGQNALATSDNGAMFSSLKNIEVPSTDEIVNLHNTLLQGRYGTFPTFERAEQTFHTGLKELLKGNITKEELGVMVDTANRDSSLISRSQTIGQASADFTLIDTGSFISDVLRNTCNSDFALYLDNGKDGLYNGKGVSAKFYKGALKNEDLLRVLPDLKTGDSDELWCVTMSGEHILDTLEYSITVDNVTGWFYYVSGLKINFDPSAEMGNRVKHITTADGQAIDVDKEYTVAVMKNSIPDEYIISCDKTGTSIYDLVKEEIQCKKTIAPANDGRFIIVN